MFAVRNYQQGVQRLLAACDEELLGQQFAEGRFRLDVKEAFYDGMRVDEETLRTMMCQCTMANLVGPKAVAAAIDLELIEADNVLHVEGVPHAQMLVMLP